MLVDLLNAPAAQNQPLAFNHLRQHETHAAHTCARVDRFPLDSAGLSYRAQTHVAIGFRPRRSGTKPLSAV